MRYRTLGRTDIEVSAVALGCWAIVGDETWGPQQEQDSFDAIGAALDAGINFFDTAEAYGDGYSEELLGRALADRRREVIIASKVSSEHLGADELRAACERSLKRLRTGYIDLYHIHWPSREAPLEESLGAMERLKAEGKIRAVGVSNFGRLDLLEVLAHGRVEVDQLPYSMLFRAIEYEIVPLCVERDVSILCYCPLAQGLLTGKFATPDDVPESRARTRHYSKDRPQSRHSEPGCEQEVFQAIGAVRDVSEGLGVTMAGAAIAWLLAQAGVGSVLAGGRNAEQVRMNAAAADLSLSEDALQQLSAATEEVKAILGPNPDMWQTDSRIR